MFCATLWAELAPRNTASWHLRIPCLCSRLRVATVPDKHTQAASPVCLHIPASAIAIVPQSCCSLVVDWLSTDVHLSSLQMFVNRAAQLLAESDEEWEASQPSWQETEVGSC